MQSCTAVQAQRAAVQAQQEAAVRPLKGSKQQQQEQWQQQRLQQRQLQQEQRRLARLEGLPLPSGHCRG